MGRYIQTWECCDADTTTEGFQFTECPFCKLEKLEKDNQLLRNTIERGIEVQDELAAENKQLKETLATYNNVLGQIKELGPINGMSYIEALKALIKINKFNYNKL